MDYQRTFKTMLKISNTSKSNAFDFKIYYSDRPTKTARNYGKD